MDINTKSAGDYFLVSPQGERLDAHAAVAFKEFMAKTIDEGNNKIVLDLRQITFIDSSGLGAIVTTLKRVGADGKLVVAGLNDKTRSIFEMTRMDRVFDIHTSVEGAFESLGIKETA